MTLIDTNVLLDLVTDDPVWAVWSAHQLEAASLRGRLVINDVVYAELSIRYARIEDLDRMVGDATLKIEAMPRAALFLAGKAFERYRRSGGRGPACCRIFSLGRTRRWPICYFSRAIRAVIGRTIQRSPCWRRLKQESRGSQICVLTRGSRSPAAKGGLNSRRSSATPSSSSETAQVMPATLARHRYSATV